LNREFAARLAEESMARWRRLELCAVAGDAEDKQLQQVVGEDGKRYSVANSALDDGDGRVRLVVAVDDGGRSA
jgi:hypothetical protein